MSDVCWCDRPREIIGREGECAECGQPIHPAPTAPPPPAEPSGDCSNCLRDGPPDLCRHECHECGRDHVHETSHHATCPVAIEWEAQRRPDYEPPPSAPPPAEPGDEVTKLRNLLAETEEARDMLAASLERWTDAPRERCGCEGCTELIPFWWVSGLCGSCANEDCEHDSDAPPPAEPEPSDWELPHDARGIESDYRRPEPEPSAGEVLERWLRAHGAGCSCSECYGAGVRATAEARGYERGMRRALSLVDAPVPGGALHPAAAEMQRRIRTAIAAELENGGPLTSVAMGDSDEYERAINDVCAWLEAQAQGCLQHGMPNMASTLRTAIGGIRLGGARGAAKRFA